MALFIRKHDDLLWDRRVNDSKKGTNREVFAAIDDGEAMYYGELKAIGWRRSIGWYRRALVQLADDRVYQPYPGDGSLTIAPDDLHQARYTKRPDLKSIICGLPEAAVIAESHLLRHEATMLERVSRRNPHPGIIRYNGVRVRRGFITGLELEAGGLNLNRYIDIYNSDRNRLKPLDPHRFMAALESAVAHVHALGYAHNDIKPDNVLVNPDTLLPTLIDFGSCFEVGIKPQPPLFMGLTPEWCDPVNDDLTASAVERDRYALSKMRDVLEETFPPAVGAKEQKGPLRRSVRLAKRAANLVPADANRVA